MIEPYAVTTPSDWGPGLNLRSHFGGVFQIDDIHQTFSDGRKADKTSFFRHRKLQESLARYLAYSGRPRHILSLPASVGCEAYSLAACFARQARKTGATAKIHMSDISEAKLRAASTGVYLKGFMNAVPEEYRGVLLKKDDVLAVVDPQLKAMVEALPPANIMDQPEMPVRYDLVMCMNLLLYLPELDDKITAARYLASLSDELLCLSYGGGDEGDLYNDAVSNALAEEGFKPTMSHLTEDKGADIQIFCKEL